MSVGQITDRNLFLIGDIFLTILCSSHILSIGVLHSTAVTLNSVSCASINITVMKALHTTAKITGQLLTIIPTHSASPDVAQYCLWDSGYVTTCSVIPGTSSSTEHVVVVTIPGALIEPVNPEATFIRLCNDINTDVFSQVSGGQSTWQVSCDALQAACDLLWAKAVEMKVSVKSIASITPVNVKSFPYQFPDGTPVVIISVKASSQLTASEGEHITTCPLCDTKVVNMHNHVGCHILCTLTDTPEELPLKQEVGLTSPYSFCGHAGVPEYGSVNSGLKNKPCRNLPLKCELCHPVLPPQPRKSTQKAPALPVEAIWRYNMMAHILDQHKEYVVPGHREARVPLPVSVWNTMKLMDLEQGTSCIPKDRWQPSYGDASEQDKENMPVASSSCTKHPALKSAGSLPPKRAHTSLQLRLSIV
ncbi:hypothetical protein BD769DRAFT_1673280 [Suillus cothurnatus]|nr:hypothetical protein BD769DRAFT_1673280 [Suillus cothurnatus]